MKKKMEGVSDNKVADGLKTVDKAREKYCAYHTNTVFGAAENYDLCLCSSKFGIEKCVELIKNAL